MIMPFTFKFMDDLV